MKILVPIKRVADPDNANKVKISADGKEVTTEGLSWDVNPFDLYAVEAAIRMTENGPKKMRLGEVVVMTIGPKEVNIQLRRCLAMGAEKAVRVDSEDPKLDSWVVARTIAKVYEKEKPDAVFIGKQVVDGESMQVAQILSRLLGMAQATFIAGIEHKPDDTAVTLTREVDGGIFKARLSLPAIVSFNERILQSRAVKNGVTPETHNYPNDNVRYTPLPMIKKAEKKPLEETTLADLGVDETMKVEYIGFQAPAARKAGIKVESVEALVDKLKNEARVI
ncbi:MAG: electron transfer flavoprotein subunit beta/FixA family protein [Pseudomonadota bacterium]